LKRWQFPIIASRFVASFLSYQLQGSLPQSTLSPQRKKKRLTADKKNHHGVTRKFTDFLTADRRRRTQTARITWKLDEEPFADKNK